jgi:hypothetical protein
MAIARCGYHTPDGTKYEYKAYALPVSHPDSGVICGRVGCEEGARLWLTDDEVKEHKGGARIFGIRTHSAKVRVSDQLISN